MISKNEQYFVARNLFQTEGTLGTMEYLVKEPDWEGSETLPSESWKNPLLTFQDRLLIADGAYAFQDKVIKNLRTRIKSLEVQLAKARVYRCEKCVHDSRNGDVGEKCIKCTDFNNWEPK